MKIKEIAKKYLKDKTLKPILRLGTGIPCVEYCYLKNV